MRLNLVNTGVRYNATDVRLDSGKASDKTLSPGNLAPRRAEECMHDVRLRMGG